MSKQFGVEDPEATVRLNTLLLDPLAVLLTLVGGAAVSEHFRRFG